MVDGDANSASNLSRIPGVSLDATGFVHTPYGTYHPVTGKGLPIDAPNELMRAILLALIDDGLASGFVDDFDFEEFIEREFGSGSD